LADSEEPRSEAELANLAFFHLAEAMSGAQRSLPCGPGEDAGLVFGHLTAFIEEWPVILELASIRRPADGNVIYFDHVEDPSAT